MTKLFYIALFTFIGFFLTPTEAYACGSKSEKTVTNFNKQSDSKMEKKDCCDKENGQCNNHEKNCDGSCGNPSCHCPTNYANFTTLFLTPFSYTELIISKPKFYYHETYYSSGFLSIWLPPKIG